MTTANTSQAPAPRRGTDPHRWRALLLVALVLTALPAALALAQVLQPPPPVDPFEQAAQRLNVARGSLVVGHETYKASCAVCHGAEGQGIPRLGKPLKNSGYVQAQSDRELLQLLAQGRPATHPDNTTGIAMPPRAGNPTLTDARLGDVVQYLRMLQEPGASLASTEAWVRPASAPALATATTPESGGTPQVAGSPGHDLFVSSCSACHGASGEGLEGLGKPLADSEFVAAKTDAELVTFVKQGRPIWDANNTTGIDMPPKGGNPALGDDELREIVRFIRSLQPDASGDA